MATATTSLSSRLKKDFTWVLSGNVLYSACQWAIVLILAKLGSPSQVGEYALAIALSAPIVMFANLQLRALLASDVQNEFPFGQYMTFRLLTLAAALAAVACVARLQVPHLAGIVILAGFAQALEFVSDTYYGLMQKHQRMDRISHSLMLRGPISLAAMALAMYLTRSVAWTVVGLALGRLIVLLGYDARLGFAEARGGGHLAVFEWNGPHMLRLLQTALPLGVISLLLALNTNVPRYFIQAHAGSAELGIFSAIASLLSAGTLVIAAFGQSIFLPVAQALAQSNRSQYRALVLQSVALGGALGGAGMLAAALFGRVILSKLFRPEYGSHSDLFVWLMAAGTLGFMASGAGYVMTAARSLKPQIPLFIGSAAAATAASFWFVPRYGVQGAAYAVLITAGVQLAGTALILLKIDRKFSPARQASPLFRSSGMEAPANVLE